MAAPDTELQQDVSALLPTITALLVSAAAYSGTTKAIAGSRQGIIDALRLEAAIGEALAAVAARSLAAQMRGASAALRALFLGNAEVSTSSATDDGLTVLADALRVVMVKNRQLLREGGRTRVSLPGSPFVDDIPGESDNPQVLARRVAQATRNSAIFHAADNTPDTLVLRKSWRSMKDSRVRATHAFLGDKSYEYHTVGLGDPFITIAGNRLMFPGDPTAPVEETAHCRCSLKVHL